MFDENGNKKTKRDAEDAVRKFVYAIMGLNENSTKRDRNRAMKKHGTELFEVMEEEIDIKVDTGFKESEFFNNYVETRNLSRGDRQEFWTDDKVVLSTTKIAGDHHDFTLQRLGSGESYTVTLIVMCLVHEDDLDTEYGIVRTDLLSYIVKDLLCWTNSLGNQLKCIDDYGDIIDSRYYCRTLKFEIECPNNLYAGMNNKYDNFQRI